MAYLSCLGQGGPASGDIQALIRSDPEGGVGDYLTEAKNLLASGGGAAADGLHPSHTLAFTRADCVELLFRICESYKVSSETVCAAVVLQDRFLRAACRIQAGAYDYEAMCQLARDPSMVAVTCFLIVCKFREMLCPLLQDLETLTGHRCTATAIQHAERIVLEATDWQLLDVNAIDVCNLILAAAPEAQRVHMAQHVEFLCEISYYCPELLPFSTASVAAAAFVYAAERLNIAAACSTILPSWMLTREAAMAVEVLKQCFAILRPDEVSQEARRELPQSAMDMDAMDCEGMEHFDSPTNVDAQSYYSFSAA
mmetsp:Transcript_13029/g.31954  ORF Transcript_13029/g.31954 Transcript_13029/m.31954 type:complete len:312 (-) Transcript_13029:516-1451(-)